MYTYPTEDGWERVKAFHHAIDKIWESVLDMSEEYKLIQVYTDKIEGIVSVALIGIPKLKLWDEGKRK